MASRVLSPNAMVAPTAEKAVVAQISNCDDLAVTRGITTAVLLGLMLWALAGLAFVLL